MPAVDPDLRVRLFEDADRVWREHREHLGGKFTSFIPTDYEMACETLCEVAGQGGTFIELGSGAGVVTILADLLGFEAYGIELDGWLVRASERLARAHGSDAEFVHGSFVPQSLREVVDDLSPDTLLETDGADAWDELGMQLADFDVIYDYHWPDQTEFHDQLLERARPGATVLRFSSDAGFEVTTH